MENNRIYLSLSHMGGREQAFVQQAFDTNWVVPMGPNVDGFEQDLAQFLGNGAQVAALSSGTAALHLGLILLGVEAGDEVICQSFTFSASANPIVYLGANPIFVDSERDTWNLSPELLEHAVQDRIAKGKTPKAIVVVHSYGMPAKMDELLTIANRYKIPVLEDAASALGSTYQGIHCGTLGELAALSFNGNKIITTSGGGALVSKNQGIAGRSPQRNDTDQCFQSNAGNLIEKARFLATQARDAAPHYQHSQIGYNYRMSNVVAGIGRGQMFVLPERIAQRRLNNRFYRNQLSGIEGITFQTEPNSDFYSNYWLTSILVDPEKTNDITREDLRIALEAANIESRPLWKPMHLQPVFADYPFYGNGTGEDLFNKGLCLPSGSILTEKDLQRVVNVIKQTLA